MGLIRLKDGNSEAVWVNPDFVKLVANSKTGTVVEFIDGDQIGSIMTAREVVRALNRAGRPKHQRKTSRKNTASRHIDAAEASDPQSEDA